MLLAKGLFKLPGRVAADAQHQLKPIQVRAATDLVDGGVGLFSLLVGFMLQAIGYIVLLGRDEPGSLGLDGAIVGGLLLVVGVAIPWLLWWLVRRRLLVWYLRELAHYDDRGDRRDHPSMDGLVAYGEIVGEERRPDEIDDVNVDQAKMRYILRVFRVRQSIDDTGQVRELPPA